MRRNSPERTVIVPPTSFPFALRGIRQSQRALLAANFPATARKARPKPTWDEGFEIAARQTVVPCSIGAYISSVTARIAVSFLPAMALLGIVLNEPYVIGPVG